MAPASTNGFSSKTMLELLRQRRVKSRREGEMLSCCTGGRWRGLADCLWLLLLVVIAHLGLRLVPVEGCYDRTFNSAVSQSGNFSSPGYPGNYPLFSFCRYIFQGTQDERIRITFSDFDLEPGTNAGCLFDYIDIFTIDIDMMKNLENRLCGGKIPPPFISIHNRVELVFKSDYAKAKKGFFGHYKFLDESWQPFPESSAGCGPAFLTGLGGEIRSPNYPNAFPTNAQCTWIIRVDYQKKIVLNFLEFKPSTSVHCESTFVTIYNGFSSPTSVPTEKICNTHAKREFRSKSYRVIVRFQSGSKNEDNSIGFRIVWTAVWAPKESMDKHGNPVDDHCDGFHCTGGEYCIDTSRLLCNPLQHYCISESLRCNHVPNCGAYDNSDEEGCFSHALLFVSVSVSICSFILFLSVVVVCLRRRHKLRRRRRHSSSSSSLRCDKPPSGVELESCRSGSFCHPFDPCDRNPHSSPSGFPSTDPNATRPVCYNINGSVPLGRGTPYLFRPQQMEVLMYLMRGEQDPSLIVPDAGVNFLPDREEEKTRVPRERARSFKDSTRSRSSDGVHRLVDAGTTITRGDGVFQFENTAAYSFSRRWRYRSTGTLAATQGQHEPFVCLSSDSLSCNRKPNALTSEV